jgi:hypothetical protein
MAIQNKFVIFPMMSLAYAPKKFNVHLCQKVLACFQASAAPRPENSDTNNNIHIMILL